MPATSRSRASAAEVFAICMSERMPSCMRAPPEAEITIAGTLRSAARSNWRVTSSPTTEPIEPPMNRKLKVPISTSTPSTSAEPAT